VALVNYADQRDLLVMSMVETLALQVTETLTEVVYIATAVVIMLLVLIVVLFNSVSKLRVKINAQDALITMLQNDIKWLDSRISDDNNS